MVMVMVMNLESFIPGKNRALPLWPAIEGGLTPGPGADLFDQPEVDDDLAGVSEPPPSQVDDGVGHRVGNGKDAVGAVLGIEHAIECIGIGMAGQRSTQ